MIRLYRPEIRCASPAVPSGLSSWTPFIFSGLRLSRPLVFFLCFTPWWPFVLSFYLVYN